MVLASDCHLSWIGLWVWGLGLWALSYFEFRLWGFGLKAQDVGLKIYARFEDHEANQLSCFWVQVYIPVSASSLNAHAGRTSLLLMASRLSK